ncbi:coiled-coil domain-containing protein 158-like isoform X2 [Brienomyrus brachyistius]|uniref:coiled-coil domain-containing protein 158-like isoform X2 n=1 Tax=Brienomyrus brachyistius TaxID=42636 RepID=UPI0020B204D7|nr:coiled-coil domain-containing protein 158-like isoform X2 [Brienomyrus brachyistius]
MAASSCLAAEDAPRARRTPPADGTVCQKRNRHLEELSEELHRCIMETQEMQREVERATQLTLEGIGQTPALGPLQLQPLKVSPAMPEGHFAQEGKEGRVEQTSPQDSLWQMRHSEDHRLHEQQELPLQQAVDRLQTQLQEARAEREVLAHWSAMESRRQADAQEDLCRKQGALERALREVGAALSARTGRCDRVPFAAPGPDDGRQLGVAVEMVQRDLEAENAGLWARLQPVRHSHPLEEQLEVLRSECQEKAVRLVKEKAERKRTAAQISVYQKQINNVENPLSAVHAQKAPLEQTGVLQQRLFEGQAQMKEARVIREPSVQQVQDQYCQLSQLMADLHQTQKEQNQLLCERDMARTSALDALREELDRRHLEAKQLEARAASLKQGRRQELEAEPRVLELQAESAALRLKLEDREGTVKQLQLQLDGLARLAEGQSCSLDAMQTDRSHMSDQLNQHKLEVKQVRLEQQESRAAALERELCEVQATLREKGCSLEKIVLERQHLANELKAQSVQLDALMEEQASLKQSHGAHQAELENANIHLRAQLRVARSELYHTKRALKATDGADRHGLKASVAMQRQITAKRQQIDSLQSRVQRLEETLDSLTQERQAWVADERERSRRLASVSVEWRCVQAEVEALRCLETQLRDRVEGLETALGKISVRFGECQGHVQQQEQELARLKLQHALDLRELQGRNLQTTVHLEQTNPKIFSHPSLLPTIQKNPSQSEANRGALAEDPTFELHSLVQELRSLTGDDNKPRPRRRSAPDRPRPSGLEVCPLHAADFDVRNNGFSCEGSGLPETPSRVTPLPQGTELGLDQGRRSPVYALLTSSPQISLSVTNLGTSMPPP